MSSNVNIYAYTAAANPYFVKSLAHRHGYEFDKDQPLWMAQMEANIRDNRSVFPLESLIGAFTLNEKLQFINELFDGSSDDFSSHIKALDQMDSLQAARKKLTELEDTYNWDIESEVLEDFIFRRSIISAIK